jgi:hypothetical protein
VTLPLFLLLMVGALDLGRAIMVRHTLVEAARAGCRIYALKDEGTEDDVHVVVGKVMNDARLTGYALEFDPYPAESIDQLEPVTVSVSVPYDEVSWCASWFLQGATLTGSCVMPGDTGKISGGSGGGDPSPPPPDDDDDDDHGGGRARWRPW